MEIRSDLEKLNVTLGRARRRRCGGYSVRSPRLTSPAAVKDAGGLLLDRKRIRLPGHIKSTGLHTVTVELHPDDRGVDVRDCHACPDPSSGNSAGMR